MINNNFYKNNFYKLHTYMCMYVCPYLVQMILNIRIDYMNIGVYYRRHSSQGHLRQHKKAKRRLEDFKTSFSRLLDVFWTCVLSGMRVLKPPHLANAFVKAEIQGRKNWGGKTFLFIFIFLNTENIVHIKNIYYIIIIHTTYIIINLQLHKKHITK